MPTLQEAFIEHTRTLNHKKDLPDQPASEKNFVDWLNAHCQRVRHYQATPAGAKGATIEFFDGTAVTVLTNPGIPRMEVHRGKAHDHSRRHWLAITPKTIQSRNQLQYLHGLPRLDPSNAMSNTPCKPWNQPAEEVKK